MTLRHGSICTGYGGLDMAATNVLGGQLAWWSDISKGSVAVMSHHYPETPNIGDVTVANWSSVPKVDVITAGYPCQPFSCAGKRKGANDDRNLWPYIADAVSAIRPGVVILENAAAHLRRGFDAVLGDLTARGYDTAWGIVLASTVGAPHRRARLFAVAANAHYRQRHGWKQNAKWEQVQRAASSGANSQNVPRSGASEWQTFEPAIRRWEQALGRPVPHPASIGPRGGATVSPVFGEWMMGMPEGWVTDVPGLSHKDQLMLCGNGVVPQQAEHAIRYLATELIRKGHYQ